jgi:hypothetical protein
MIHRILADLTVRTHFLWILFLVLGGLWGRRRRTVKYVHLFGLLFAITIQIFDWYCPLTHLEVWLRARQDPARAYAGSFIVHYVERLVYIEISRSLIFMLTILLIGFNMWLYMKKGGRKAPL